MKKYIFMLLISFMSILSANAQYYEPKFTYKIGAITTFCPYEFSNEYSDYGMEYAAQLGFGVRQANSYFGYGMDFGVQHQVINDKYCNDKYNTNMFAMPFYLQYAYSRPHGNYFDVKLGGIFYIYDSYTKETGFYLNVTPIGYTFDNHNSLGLGYRLVHMGNGNPVNWHGVSLSYQYTF